MNIFDPWLPRPIPITAIFNKQGRSLIWERIRKFGRSSAGIFHLMVKGYHLNAVKEDAKKCYIRLHEALAAGDRAAVDRVATMSMANELNPSLKKIKKVGRGEFKVHGEPKLEVKHVVVGKMEGGPGVPKEKTGYYAQISITVTSKQSYALYANGKLIGGDPLKINDMIEHIVIQRNLDNPNDTWLIAGKIVPKADVKATEK
ncbi:hypothetical protein HDV05_001097 [Chytridiales sp. JEL 0842]|nr:hypothetical protein HDV05_001097 [Chytridiales sp. JEL 0842]